MEFQYFVAVALNLNYDFDESFPRMIVFGANDPEEIKSLFSSNLMAWSLDERKDIIAVSEAIILIDGKIDEELSLEMLFIFKQIAENIAIDDWESNR
jgi:hypothetical protein